MTLLSYSEAIRRALDEEMARDERVVLFGEDIGIYGGAFQVTRGLLEEYGARRVIETPICENTGVGLGVGAALLGLKPIVELMFLDFLPLALDQIVNQAVKIPFVFGAEIPLVIRGAGGAGRSYGPTHSQNFAAMLQNVPGLILLAPSTPADAYGLLKSALRQSKTVIFQEHKALYPLKGEVAEGEHFTPLGKALVVREGKDMTLIASQQTLHEALEAAEILSRENIQAEVIDLRTLKPLDKETIFGSVEKTGRILIAEESPAAGSISSEIAALLLEEAYDLIDAPLQRVTLPEEPIYFAPHLEAAQLPRAAKIVTAARRISSGLSGPQSIS